MKSENPKAAIHKKYKEVRAKRIQLEREIDERTSCYRRAQIAEWNRLLRYEDRLKARLVAK